MVTLTAAFYLIKMVSLFLENMYRVFAEVFYKKTGASIVHDPRIVWNIRDIINKYGGYSIEAKTGHAFVKAAMRSAGAIYGGEVSAHHYFRDFAYCDSGMIPWLVVWELLSKSNLSMADLISDRKRKFPSSGELNFSVSNPTKCIKMVKNFFLKEATKVDEFDGLSISFENWRFNLRLSNTEPLVRLNVETKGDQLLLKEKIENLKNLILDF